MEQQKIETKTESKAAPGKEKPKKERTPLTPAERLRRQKMIVLPAMVLVFLGAMWLIFAPSSDKEMQPGIGGYNTEIPDADKEDKNIIGDKVKAYAQKEIEERRASRSRSMQELGDMFDHEVEETEAETKTEPEPAKVSTPQTIHSSAAAYRDLNTTLGNFYEEPANEDKEMDELLERIVSLETALENEKGRNSDMDEVALMEKSYELAAKYMGGQNNSTVEARSVRKAGKNKAVPVKQVTHQVVSVLGQPMSNAEFMAAHATEKNTLSACINGAQSVTDGQAVKLRLLEPMAVADRIIPRNAALVGAARIQGERLGITITSLEYEGTVIPVELSVYDTDGQPGIFIPNSMELDAVKEIAANMGRSLGSSINISTDAGAQLASDLGKGLIQGTSQYIAKKMRTVKVHLKAGYKVMLYQDEN